MSGFHSLSWKVLSLLAVSAAPGAYGSSSLEVWTRGREDQKVSLQPSGLKQEVRESFDPQYQRLHLYRGVALESLFVTAPARSGGDLALLHFQNGMVIPVHFLDLDEVRRLDAFVAFAWAPPSADRRPASGWSTAFPPLPKAGAEKADPRPLTFDGNKVVVRDGWHPASAKIPGGGFSPWRYVDALTGIEYVREAEHAASFTPRGNGNEPVLVTGHGVFQSRCQFCHGARGQGAQYGWDLVEPVPLSRHRDPKSLELHVRYRELDAAERGLMMPAFPELTRPQLDAFWRWMDALAKPDPSQEATR